MHWLPHILGLDDASSSWYLFWSGIEGDLQQITVVGAVVIWYRHRKCRSCWRLGKHVVEGTAWSTCHRHLTGEHHDTLLARYRRRHPDQHAFLRSHRADSDKLRQP